MHTDCSHIEDVHLLFRAHFINIVSFLGVLNLNIFPSQMLRWCLVFVICNTFHSFIFKLCKMIVHTLKMCTLLFCAHLINIFSFLMGVQLRHFFHPKSLWGCLVCVICYSNIVNSFIFKRCIMVFHTMKMCSSYFVQIS